MCGALSPSCFCAASSAKQAPSALVPSHFIVHSRIDRENVTSKNVTEITEEYGGCFAYF